MYYDQLKALKLELEEMLLRVINDYSQSVEDRDNKIMAIVTRMHKVAERMSIAKGRIGRYPNTSNSDEAKLFKKEVKHEFLTQAQAGYTVGEIISYIKDNMNNPGVNIEKIIESLRDQKEHEGHFIYGNPSSSDSEIILTDKGKRYLENTANVSLKR